MLVGRGVEDELRTVALAEAHEPVRLADVGHLGAHHELRVLGLELAGVQVEAVLVDVDQDELGALVGRYLPGDLAADGAGTPGDHDAPALHLGPDFLLVEVNLDAREQVFRGEVVEDGRADPVVHLGERGRDDLEPGLRPGAEGEHLPQPLGGELHDGDHHQRDVVPADDLGQVVDGAEDRLPAQGGASLAWRVVDEPDHPQLLLRGPADVPRSRNLRRCRPRR